MGNDGNLTCLSFLSGLELVVFDECEELEDSKGVSSKEKLIRVQVTVAINIYYKLRMEG
jgi:hypothetical protein